MRTLSSPEHDAADHQDHCTHTDESDDLEEVLGGGAQPYASVPTDAAHRMPPKAL